MIYFAHAGEHHDTPAEEQAHQIAVPGPNQTVPTAPDRGLVDPVFIVAAIVILVIGSAMAAYAVISSRKGGGNDSRL